jgi:DNA-binding transcriptional ArsR family regulator
MPRLSQTTIEAPWLQFVVSPALDMLNAMYFTSLVPQMEGVDGWPEQLRREMAPDLLEELDALYNYPAGDPGVLGIFGDNMFVHPELWGDIESLVSYVRTMPLGIGQPPGNPGIQGLIHETTFRYPEDVDHAEYASLPPREAVERRMRSLDDRDADAIMTLYDHPEELRERMAVLLERFYAEHYRSEMPKRMPALHRSVATHRQETVTDAGQLAARLTGRNTCLEGVCAGPFTRLVFTPSTDMGVYSSCSSIGQTHGLYYPCEPEYMGAQPDEAQETRLARIYKALGDEQRLRILRMLSEQEMYAQEIVERTGLHQSVVSRHLTFMKAVGLLNARKHNNMKFYSLNPAAREMLTGTLTLFEPVATR